MLTATATALRSADPMTLGIEFDADTGAVNVYSAEGVLLALGVFDLDRWEFAEPSDLGELPEHHPEEAPDYWREEVAAELRVLLEDLEPEETWEDDIDDGADDAYALASAFGYDPEYC